MTPPFPSAVAETLRAIRALRPGELVRGTYPDAIPAVFTFVRAAGAPSRNRFPARSSAPVAVLVYDADHDAAERRASDLEAALLTFAGDDRVSGFRPLSGPVADDDPDNGRPFASFSVVAHLRPTPIP